MKTEINEIIDAKKNSGTNGIGGSFMMLKTLPFA